MSSFRGVHYTSNPTDTVDVDNTYTWTVTNNSTTNTLTGVVLGSHWGDYCVGATTGTDQTPCHITPPTGPTLISLAPGCGGQSTDEFDPSFAVFGIWCTPSSGVALLPGASVSGSITLRPGTGGPAFYTVYSGHDPLTPSLAPGAANKLVPDPVINYRGFVAPAATDIQMTGAASTGSPAVGSEFTYTFQVKNAGPWGTFGGIILTDTLPASVTYVSSSVTEAALDSETGETVQKAAASNLCSVVGQNVVCPLEDMTNGGVANQATVTLTVMAPSVAQQIVNTATVHTVASQNDLNLVNNNVSVTVTAK